jgi:hypothetical protein
MRQNFLATRRVRIAFQMLTKVAKPVLSVPEGDPTMSGRNTAVFGIYRTRKAAEAAVVELIAAGFPRTDVSVLLPDVQSKKALAATTGVAAGGALGGTLGLLAGIGALAIPGLGSFIAAGPIMGALAGAGAGGAVGGIVGALVGMGIPEDDAKRYEGHIKNGGVLLSVHGDTSDEVLRAKETLRHTGAADIASTGEASRGAAY